MRIEKRGRSPVSTCVFQRPVKDWIRAVRVSLGESQEEFGKRFGKTRGNVSSWEQGRHEPSFAHVIAMIAASDSLPPGVLESGKSASLRHIRELLRSSNLEEWDKRLDPAPAPLITYWVVKGVVAGALQGLGLRFEDLVIDDAEARKRIEAALANECAKP